MTGTAGTRAACRADPSGTRWPRNCCTYYVRSCSTRTRYKAVPSTRDTGAPGARPPTASGSRGPSRRAIGSTGSRDQCPGPPALVTGGQLPPRTSISLPRPLKQRQHGLMAQRQHGLMAQLWHRCFLGPQ